jgi:hypothetical protein
LFQGYGRFYVICRLLIVIFLGWQFLALDRFYGSERPAAVIAARALEIPAWLDVRDPEQARGHTVSYKKIRA